MQSVLNLLKAFWWWKWKKNPSQNCIPPEQRKRMNEQASERVNDSFKGYFFPYSHHHTTHSHRQHHHHGFKYLDYDLKGRKTRLNCDVTMVTKRHAKKDHHHRKLKNGSSSSFRNSEKIYDFSRNFPFVLKNLWAFSDSVKWYFQSELVLLFSYSTHSIHIE